MEVRWWALDVDAVRVEIEVELDIFLAAQKHDHTSEASQLILPSSLNRILGKTQLEKIIL